MLLLLGRAWASPTLIMTTYHVAGNVCIYVSIYLAACSVCRLNVPENTPIQSITRSAHMHIGNAHCADWTGSFKNRLQKLGQLLAQGFCCVDRVSVQARATACSPVRCWRSEGDSMRVGDVPWEACFTSSVRCKLDCIEDSYAPEL